VFGVHLLLLHLVGPCEQANTLQRIPKSCDQLRNLESPSNNTLFLIPHSIFLSTPDLFSHHHRKHEDSAMTNYGAASHSYASPAVDPIPTIAHDDPDQTQEADAKKRKTTKRRKVNHACLYCRRSHMTCDEGRPCQRW